MARVKSGKAGGAGTSSAKTRTPKRRTYDTSGVPF